MNICYFGTFEQDYPRNVTFIRGLAKSGHSVTVVSYEVKAGDTGQIGRLSRLARLLCVYVKAYLFLFMKAVAMPRPDAVIIGYPAHVDVLAFSWLFRLRGIPLFFNPLVSLYDTFVTDRRIFGELTMTARVLRVVDRTVFRIPVGVFIDTRAHAKYLSMLLDVNIDHFHVVPVGAVDDFFADTDVAKSDVFQVFYCGKYIPLHGVETIIDSAVQLRGDPIKFVMTGRGQEYGDARKKADEHKLTGLTFVDWMNRRDVLSTIRQSHVVLGIFKKGGKASRVIPNKVFDALAAGAIVITERSPAVEELFADGVHLFLVEPGDASALADRIRWIREHFDEAAAVGVRGRSRVVEIATEERIGTRVAAIIAKETSAGKAA